MRRGLGILVLLAAAAASASARQGQGLGAGRGRPSPTRLGVIAGQVVDPSGQPVDDVFVSALVPLPAGTNPGFKTPNPSVKAITEADGRFVVDVGSWGEFYLVAFPHNALRDAKTLQVLRSGYGITFYPNASSIATAGRVRIAPGNATPVTITLRRVPLAIVSGVVTDSSGHLVRSGTVNLRHLDGLGALDSRTFKIDGAFQILVVPPGNYQLQYFEERQMLGRPFTLPNTISVASIVVDGHDLVNVRVTPVHPATIAGRVLLPAALPAWTNVGQISLQPEPADPDAGPTRAFPTRLKADRTFEIRAWPGPTRIMVRPETDWRIKAMRLNGRNVAGQWLTVTDGQALRGLEIELEGTWQLGRK